jgi:hypothetical protein
MRPLLAVICMERITGSFPSIPVQSCCSHLALSVPTYWHAQVWLVLAVVHRNQQQWADALECIENAVAVSLCASRRSANRGSGESAPARAARLSAACDAQLVEKDASAADENLTSQIQARLLRAQAAAANECPSSLVYSSARGVPPPALDAPTAPFVDRPIDAYGRMSLRPSRCGRARPRRSFASGAVDSGTEWQGAWWSSTLSLCLTCAIVTGDV